MKYENIELLSNIESLNGILPFHYPVKSEKNYSNNQIRNQINLEEFYNIYNNYNKNHLENNQINYKIKENLNNNINNSQYQEKYIKNNSKKNKYHFIPKRRKSTNYNLSENISIKNNSLNKDIIHNIKYNNIKKNYSNNYIIGSSNNLVKHQYYDHSLLEDNTSIKKLRRSSSNSNPHFKSSINNDRKNYSNISYKQSNSYRKKLVRKNVIIKRNKNNNVISSKSQSSIEKKKPIFDRPKSCEFKTNDKEYNNNDIIYKYLNKNQNVLYNNKMAKIDKYLNEYFYENNKKHQISFNKKRKNNKNIKNIVVNSSKDYYTENAIFRKKSNKTNKNKEKMSSSNNLFKNYYTSKGIYLKKEEHFFKNENNLLEKQKSKIYNKKLNENNIIDNIESINNSPTFNANNNSYKIKSTTIQQNINKEDKKMKKIIKYKYSNHKDYSKKSNKLNYLYRNISEENKRNPLNEKKLDYLNRELKNKYITPENKKWNDKNFEIINKENQSLNSINSINAHKNRNNKTKRIPVIKKEHNTISSHNDFINKNKNVINNIINNNKKIGMNTYNKFYTKKNDEENFIKKYFLNNNNELYDSLNNNDNIQINKNPIFSYKNKNTANDLNEIKNRQNSYSELISKNNIINNNFNSKIRNNSSFNLFNNNNQNHLNEEQNLSDIRRYLHNYYEIKSKNNFRKNNSFNNIKTYNQKERIYDNTLKINLFKNLMKNEENKDFNNNNYYNNLSSNVNININITPNQISNENIDIKVNNINKQNIIEKNEYNSKQLFTPSFMKTKKELSNENKISIQKNMETVFQNNNIVDLKNNKNNQTNNYFEPNNERIKFDNYNNFGYDYTFKNINYKNNDNVKNSDKEAIFNNKYYYKEHSDKRKDDLIQLINFSENLGLNYKQ